MSESFDLFSKHFEPHLNNLGVDRNNYLSFEERAAGYGVQEESFCGRGHLLSPSIGLYALNTAIFSLGGLTRSGAPGTESIKDEGQLPVETRGLHEWLQSTSHDFRILVMHHPPEMLCFWAREEITTIIDNYFNIVFVGHVHKPDARYVRSTTTGSVICIAPALFTRKRDALGYSVVTIADNLSAVKIQYRHLSRERRFVRGTYFSSTEDGSTLFTLKAELAARATSEGTTASILRASFERAATCAPAIGHLWVASTLGAQPEVARDDKASPISADHLMIMNEDIIIFGPPQFGLSVLGRFLALDAWQKHPGEACLCFACDELPNHVAGIVTRVNQELAAIAASTARVSAFILDDFDYNNQLNMRKLRSIRTAFPGCTLVLLCKLDPSRPSFLEGAPQEVSSLKRMFLWSLTQGQVRSLADQYVEAAGSRIDTNDLVLRSVENLEKLNLHRTPPNVITLFRIADSSIDISPVNRTEMCERFLFLLFTDFAELPRYGTRPDLKDSVYAFGAFSEFLIRRGNIIFTKKEFFREVASYCDRRLLRIEVDILFMFLPEESLVIQRGMLYCFRFLYWIRRWGSA